MSPVTIHACRRRPIILTMIVVAVGAAGAIAPANPSAPAPAVVAGSPATPAATTAKAKPPLRFEVEERVLDVGYYRREFFLEFLFVTESTGAVRIKNFTSSCPCTTVAMEKTTYYPGQKGMVAAVYDYAGEIAEPPVQIVHVLTDRAPQPILLRVVPRRSAQGIWTERKELRWIDSQARELQSVEVEVAPEFKDRMLVATVAGAADGNWRTKIEPMPQKGRYRLSVEPTREQLMATSLKLTFEKASGAASAEPTETAAATITLFPAEG